MAGIGRPKGLPKYGGRKKGTPNKKTTEIQEIAKARGITPLDYMLNLLNDISQETEIRLDAAKSAAPFVHSKMPTALQVSGTLNHIHELALDELE